MMKWWIDNGSYPELAKRDRIAATRQMTAKLASRYDAVWFKGKGLYTLLDGDQVCVYNPSNIYEIDKSLTKAQAEKGAPFSKVRMVNPVTEKTKKIPVGTKGTVLTVEDIPNKEKMEEIRKTAPMYFQWLDPQTTKFYVIKWDKGGTMPQVQDVEIELL